jgi:hypothetical protein
MPRGERSKRGGERKGSGRGGSQTKPAPIAVEKYLKGVDFPCNKEELMEHARERGAPEEVQAALARLPDREYESPADISKEMGQIE